MGHRYVWILISEDQRLMDGAAISEL